MVLLRIGALVCLLLAGCSPYGTDIAQKNPVDCVFNGPCTGAPVHTGQR